MKRLVVILVILLVVSISFVLAKEVSIPEVHEAGEETSGSDEEEVVSQDREGRVSTEVTYYYTGSQLLASDGSEGRKYYHQDRLGSNRVITGPSGSEIDQYRSLPFGQVFDKLNEKFSFTGKELDEESGLHDFGARYYDSDTGRFISSDPVPNEPPYAYVANNPMNLVDPTGMAAIDDLDWCTNGFKMPGAYFGSLDIGRGTTGLTDNQLEYTGPTGEGLSPGDGATSIGLSLSSPSLRHVAGRWLLGAGLSAYGSYTTETNLPNLGGLENRESVLSYGIGSHFDAKYLFSGRGTGGSFFQEYAGLGISAPLYSRTTVNSDITDIIMGPGPETMHYSDTTVRGSSIGAASLTLRKALPSWAKI